MPNNTIQLTPSRFIMISFTFIPIQPRSQGVADLVIVRPLMFTESEAKKLAKQWVAAWNSHDLDEIMSHYAQNVILVSPVAVKLLHDASGTVSGKDALRIYFRRGLEAYPDLKFELVDVMWGISSVVLYYVNQKGTKTGEFMEVDPDGKITRVVANYNG